MPNLPAVCIAGLRKEPADFDFTIAICRRKQVAEDYRFKKNLYDIWLKGNHYKWRAMRPTVWPSVCVR
ncbi:glucuronate isomerase [Escherichia coli]